MHNIHKKYIKDNYTIKVIEDYLFIGKGVALGVEMAQKEANIIPNLLDYYVQNNYVIERYMGDTIYFVKNLKEASNSLKYYIDMASNLDIKLI